MPSRYGVVTERIRDLLAIEDAKERLKYQLRQAGRRILTDREGPPGSRLRDLWMKQGSFFGVEGNTNQESTV